MRVVAAQQFSCAPGRPNTGENETKKRDGDDSKMQRSNKFGLCAMTKPVLSRLVQVRFANDRSELGLIELNLRSVVFAPGETEVTTNEAHLFRYVVAFAPDVRVEVVP